MTDVTPASPLRRVTMQQIADHLHITKATVSLALRHDPRVRPITIERVETTARELGYDPAPASAARRLSLQKGDTRIINQVIGCVFPASMRSEFHTRLAHGIEDSLLDDAYALVKTSFRLDHDFNRQKHPLPAIFFRGEVDGLLMLPERTDFSLLLDQLRRSPGFGDRPIVTLLEPLPGCATVMADANQGAYDSARYLLDLGHRCLIQLFVRNWERGAIDGRRAAVKAAMLDAGLDPEHCYLEFGMSPDWLSPRDSMHDRTGVGRERWGRDRTRFEFLRFLKEHPQATAILGRNDSSARFAWYTLQDAGMRVPEDYSIFGFDDTDPKYDEHGANLLSSVRVPLEAIGREAATLIRKLVHGAPAPDDPIVFPTELVVRASTAPPRLSTIEALQHGLS